MKKPRESTRIDTPPPGRPSNPDLDDPATRIIFSAVALHGMLAGKTALPQHAADQSQDERRSAAAQRLAVDAVAVADALIEALRG